MKILVTGGAGLIASHITDAYLKAGHKVVVLDNLTYGFRRNLNPRAKLYNVDLCDREAVEKVFKKERPEIVNHHGAIAVIAEALRDPIPTFEVNLLGTTNVLVAFGKYGAGKNKKFIFASSGAVYGTPKKIPVTEETPTNPESAYGLSKLLGEEIIEFYAKLYNFHYLLFRYPNVYGPRQNPKGEAGVIAIFTGLMKAGKSPTIFGDGTMLRDYTHVWDIARANVLALTKGKDIIINLGWGKGTSVQAVFDALAKEIGFKGKAIHVPFRKGDAKRMALSTKRARSVLGWKPSVMLEEGMKTVVESL